MNSPSEHTGNSAKQSTMHNANAVQHACDDSTLPDSIHSLCWIQCPASTWCRVTYRTRHVYTCDMAVAAYLVRKTTSLTHLFAVPHSYDYMRKRPNHGIPRHIRLKGAAHQETNRAEKRPRPEVKRRLGQ